MIYHKLKTVFPHLVKTGGSTLEYHLGQIEEPEIYKEYKDIKQKMKFLNVLYKQNQLEPEDRRWNIHRYAKQYKKELGDAYDEYYSFSIVRNPFSQIKSLYSMDKWDHDRRNKPFPDWEEYILGSGRQSISGVKFHLDQWALLSEKGKLIVNEIFPFEYYKEVLVKLGKKFNFTPDFDVRLWSTKPQHDYTPEMVNKVLDEYNKSYELWNKVKKQWEKTKTPYVGRKKRSRRSSSKG